MQQAELYFRIQNAFTIIGLIALGIAVIGYAVLLIIVAINNKRK